MAWLRAGDTLLSKHVMLWVTLVYWRIYGSPGLDELTVGKCLIESKGQLDPM